MKRSVLISLIPAVLGCANIKSNPCAMSVAANTAACADVNDASSVPEWAAGCSMNSLIKECKCQYTAGGDAEAPAPAPAPAATTLATRVASAAPKATAEEPVKSAPADTGAVAGSCSAAQVDELVGYGFGTTGGSGAPVVVKSCSELKSALDKGGVIHIDGMLDGCDLMKVPSDTTILGVGSNSGLTNGGFRIVKSNNVIIRNLVLRNPPKEMDCIDIETSTYVWIDHNDFATEGIDGTDKDYFDGLLDAKRASDFLTFSWNKFADHWKASLIGHSDDNGSQDEGKLHVTYHHNYWSNINSRAPSIRFGTAHIYSSCYEDLPTSGVNSRMGAKVLVESTAFKNVRRPIITNLDSREDGFAVERNNLFENSETAITQEKDFTPPYEYTTSSADCVCELVKSKAGTGVISI